jgi:hypothetical protein
MRPERITLQQAQRVYNEIKAAVPTIAKYDSKYKSFPGVPLPDIDMAAIFAGRKSMNVAHVLRAVEAIIATIGRN